MMLTHHMRDVPAGECIPKGATLAIKEPYLNMDMVHPPRDTSNMEVNLKSMFFVIRVDHPIDLVVLPPCDRHVPLPFRAATSVGTTASWKERGNTAFAHGRVLEAQRWSVWSIHSESHD
jgi:hypothetical protein